MIRYIKFSGEDVAVDFSIRTLSILGREYNTDVTGLAEIVASQAENVDEILELIERLAVLALNDGAERTGDKRRYTKFDVRDAVTVDATLGETLLNMLMETFQQAEVFPKPPTEVAKPKVKK